MLYQESQFNRDKADYEYMLNYARKVLDKYRSASDYVKKFIDYDQLEKMVDQLLEEAPKRGFISEPENSSENTHESRYERNAKYLEGFPEELPDLKDIDKGGIIKNAASLIRNMVVGYRFTAEQYVRVRKVANIIYNLSNELYQNAQALFKSEDSLKNAYDEIKEEKRNEAQKLLEDTGAPLLGEDDEIEERVLKTSLTSEYVPHSWDFQRLLIDICQNHLPSDSGGTKTTVEFRTKDGIWHDHSELFDYADIDITMVRISDDGVGFVPENLQYLYSSKSSENTGKWGEGLKMSVASALRMGMKVELRSRDWVADPSLEFVTIGEDTTQALQFRVFSKKTDERQEDEHIPTGSATVFSNLPTGFLVALRDLDISILYFSDKKPILETPEVDLLSLDGGPKYVKGLLIPNSPKTLYSYNLKQFDVETRDRDHISPDALEGAIKPLLENLQDKKIIKDLLQKAFIFSEHDYGDISPIEFLIDLEIEPRSETAKIWIEAFQELFGENAAIRGAWDTDMNAVHQAEHLGLSVVTLPPNLARSLQNIEGPNGERIISYDSALREAIENSQEIPEDQLTQQEKAVIEFLLKDVAPLLPQRNGEPVIKHIKVFEYDKEYSGVEAAGFATMGDTISICRESFKNILRLFDVFFHESAHAYTGAQDAEKAFRDFLTQTMAVMASRQLFGERAEEIPSILQGPSGLSLSGDEIRPPFDEEGWEVVSEGEPKEPVVVSESIVDDPNPEVWDDEIIDGATSIDDETVLEVHPDEIGEMSEEEYSQIKKRDDADTTLEDSFEEPEALVGDTTISELDQLVELIRLGKEEESKDLSELVVLLQDAKKKGYSLSDIRRACKMIEQDKKRR